MADDRSVQDRPVKRCFEGHRLEEQLWSLAYQQVLPLIRRKTRAKVANYYRRYQSAAANAAKARRA